MSSVSNWSLHIHSYCYAVASGKMNKGAMSFSVTEAAGGGSESFNLQQAVDIIDVIAKVSKNLKDCVRKVGLLVELEMSQMLYDRVINEQTQFSFPAHIPLHLHKGRSFDIRVHLKYAPEKGPMIHFFPPYSTYLNPGEEPAAASAVSLNPSAALNNKDDVWELNEHEMKDLQSFFGGQIIGKPIKN